jgi:demethoxyubiquinone hydroxylase (CLK1/Coq7/Cat5 family)
LENKAEEALFYKLFSSSIKIGCKLAIGLAKKF